MYAHKTIILTGASEGIGRALALELATDAPKLVLAARNLERLESLAADCETLGATCLVLPTDVTDEAACRSLIEKTVERFGGLDVLVNNAGGSMWARLDEMQDTSALEGLMRLNYLSAAWCTYYALPALKKSRGQVVAVASVAGLTGVPTRTGYSAAKHAMFGFFDSLRIELAGDGVGVTIIAPDFVLTEIHERAIGPDGRPIGESPLEARKGVMTSEECAARIYQAMTVRKRLLITSFRGKLGRLLRILAPSVIDRLAAKAISGLR
ncbi:MAG: SDR family oxidoreductase [Gammaproteobacteria bacterium]|nr:SDR family oxidoreductase [Gammaproteobacteria bacterium]